MSPDRAVAIAALLHRLERLAQAERARAERERQIEASRLDGLRDAMAGLQQPRLTQMLTAAEPAAQARLTQAEAASEQATEAWKDLAGKRLAADAMASRIEALAQARRERLALEEMIGNRLARSLAQAWHQSDE